MDIRTEESYIFMGVDEKESGLYRGSRMIKNPNTRNLKPHSDAFTGKCIT